MASISDTKFNQVESNFPNYTLARSILGEDFISPEDITLAYGLAYTEEQLMSLWNKSPNKATLEAVYDADMMLVAGPPKAMSMLDIFFICNKNSCWKSQINFNYTLCCKEKIEPLIWIAFSKKPVKGSLFRNWSEQKVLIKTPVYVPNVVETVWCLSTYKKVNNTYLLKDTSVRTTSLSSKGSCFYVGYFDIESMSIDDYCDNDSYGFLGVSAARRF